SGDVWVEKLGCAAVAVGTLLPGQVYSIIGTVAATLNTVANADNPILEGELPIDGSRFEGIVPPVVSAPTITIRRRASRIFTLDEYVETGVMSQEQRELLGEAVGNHKNILVCGGTGSGKTTLTNAIIAEIVERSPTDRLVIIEDTYELQCSARNHVTLHCTERITMDALLRATLRMRPDRILVGEVRGPEALALLKAWNTGHPGGLATIHANSPIGALTRLEQLSGEVSASNKHLAALIAEAVDLIAFIQRTPTGRVLQEVTEVNVDDQGGYVMPQLGGQMRVVPVAA
ncbi:MAG: P-type conjugative transfer ATPase TrbB, partial [Burkholderiaceae bacterium]